MILKRFPSLPFVLKRFPPFICSHNYQKEQNMIKELYNRLDRIERLLEENHHNDVVYLNIDETAEFIKMKKSSIYQLVFQRKIPYCKRGKILLFDKAELVRWIEGRKMETFETLAEKVKLDVIIERYKGKDNGLGKFKTKTD